jgi:hypothetical protein
MQQIQSSNPKYNPHPLAEFFPLMEGQEFDELVGNIKRRGLHFPITIFDNQIIDGRNRDRACLKAGVEPRYVAFAGKAEDIPRFIISANIHRRHLKPQQRRELLKKLINLHPELSNRAIADMAHVSHATVGAVRTEMQSTGQIDQLKKTVGKDGKSRRQPAPKPRSASAPKLAALPKPAIEQIRETIAPDEELALLREFARFVIEREGKCNLRPEDRPQWLILRERIQATLRASPTPSHREYIAKTNGAAATAA